MLWCFFKMIAQNYLSIGTKTSDSSSFVRISFFLVDFPPNFRTLLIFLRNSLEKIVSLKCSISLLYTHLKSSKNVCIKHTFNNKRWRLNSAGKMIQTCLKKVEKYEFNKVAILALLKLGALACFEVYYFICEMWANVQCLKNEMNIHTSTFRIEKFIF